ncbi:12639_t:CDS:2, partial [Gigaspora margarita]
VLLETLADERIKLRQLLSQYEPENIYNADETGLFYQMLPNQTLVQQAVSGQKRDKSRLIVLLAMNTTELHKLILLVIGKSIKPQSFNGINISQLSVTYENNKRAWIKFDIWEKWLTFHNRGFHIQNKKVLLIVDNAKSHSAPEMPAFSNNINGNKERPENDELDSEYKDSENFIFKSNKNDEISNSKVLVEKLVKVLVEVLVEVLVKELVEELIEGCVEDHELKGP